MWNAETADEYTAVMADTDARQREEDGGPGLLVIIDAGEVDMDILAALFD
jgi:hypothetical protein